MSPSSDVPAKFTNNHLSFPEIDSETASLEEFTQHCSDLVAFRKAAHRHLLHPGWSFTSPILSYGNLRGDMPLHPQRPLPDFALRGGNYRLTLKHALQPFQPVSNIHATLHARCSQVWVADVHAATKSNMPLSPSLGSVVLKIFQSSLFPIPRVSDYKNKNDNHLHARELANTEFFMYERMRSLQGECVPYCFGRTKTLMPNGEEARILILELINGTSLKAWCREFTVLPQELQDERLEGELSSILHAVYKSVRKLEDVGVYHQDVMPRNLIYVESNGIVQVVLIDFALSDLDDADDINPPPDEAVSAVHSVLRSCFKMYPNSMRWTGRAGYLPENVKWYKKT